MSQDCSRLSVKKGADTWLWVERRTGRAKGRVTMTSGRSGVGVERIGSREDRRWGKMEDQLPGWKRRLPWWVQVQERDEDPRG